MGAIAPVCLPGAEVMSNQMGLTRSLVLSLCPCCLLLRLLLILTSTRSPRGTPPVTTRRGFPSSRVPVVDHLRVLQPAGGGCDPCWSVAEPSRCWGVQMVGKGFQWVQSGRQAKQGLGARLPAWVATLGTRGGWALGSRVGAKPSSCRASSHGLIIPLSHSGLQRLGCTRRLGEAGARAWVGAPRGPTSSELGHGAGLGAQPSPNSMPPSFSCILSQTLGMS